MKKKLIKIFAVLFLLALVLVLLVFFYFFHTTVRIDSDFEVKDICVVDEDGNRTQMNKTKFSHEAMYGKYNYEMMVQNHKFVISVFKINDYQHYNVDIDIKGIDGMGVEPFEVTVSVDGSPCESEIFDFNDIDEVYMSVGP